MKLVDKNYLSLQFWNRIYQKNAMEYQSFFEDIMQKAFTDFQKIRPYGNKGDGGNDGYRPSEGIYYQVYAPKDPHEKEAYAAKKLREAFSDLKNIWDEISIIKVFNFVFNDKGAGVSIEIEKAIAELKKENPTIEFNKFLPKDLEEIFFGLNESQILSLGFDIDSRNAVRITYELLEKAENDLDRENVTFVLKTLENVKSIIVTLQDDVLTLDYEILECRTLQKLERTKEAKEKYENIYKRYPKDPRAPLYLAEYYINQENYDKNEELLNEVEQIDSTYWLFKIENLIREYRLGHQIDILSIDEKAWPKDPKIKSLFYRIYFLFILPQDIARAESFIERALYFHPAKFSNYDAKLSLLENRLLPLQNNIEEIKEAVNKLFREIESVEKKFDEFGGLSPRSKIILNIRRIHLLSSLYDIPEIGRYAKETFELVLGCYFDQLIDNVISDILNFIVLPQNDFARCLKYLQIAEKPISERLAQAITIQFLYKDNLFTDGKIFFQTIKKIDLVDFIVNIEGKNYDKALAFLKRDSLFAVHLANLSKGLPEFRRKIIENLPDDGNIQKEKLLLLLNFDEGNIDEAFDILKGLDLSDLSYVECQPTLKIAQQKKAWDFAIILLDKLLQYEKDKSNILQLKLQLFTANFNLERYPEVIRIGEKILSNEEAPSLLSDKNKEILLAQTIFSMMRRGEYLEAKKLLEKYSDLLISFESKASIEAEVYIKNNDANKALDSVIDAVKMLRRPSPEEYGSLFIIFTQIGNLINISLTPLDKAEENCFVKLKDQDRWFFIGSSDELDATKISNDDQIYDELVNKKIGEKVIFKNKYRSSNAEYEIENIYSVEKYIHWQSIQNAQKLSLERRWDKMELIEVPTTGETIDTQYLIARLEDEQKKRGNFFDLYCQNEVPLALLAINQGGLTNAIGLISNENRGFIKATTGAPSEFSAQKEIAKKIIAGQPFYIDGTSALILSEPGLIETIINYLPNILIPQSVISFLLDTVDKFRYWPGQFGHMAYSQGRISFSSIDNLKRSTIQNNFEKSIKLLESNSQNIKVISSANKTASFLEQNVPSYLCDACILAQKDSVPVLTEDFLYLKVNELETKKTAPEYCSSFALVKVLFEQKKISFNQYLDSFAYLSSYRFRFLFLSVEDLEKAVFGDKCVTLFRPEEIRKFNFPLTLSEEYGVPFTNAIRVIVQFMIKVLLDDSVSQVNTEKIFAEIISTFPTDQDRKPFGKMLLRVCIQVINDKRRTIIISIRVQEKINSLAQFIQTYNPNIFLIS